MWNDLGLPDKARMIQLAVKSGITDLRTIEEVYNTYASGGKIHIKPENRGKFTALKKRTGHSASWFKEHGTPAQKKMAVFALNARKWKHEDGGPLKIEDPNPSYIPESLFVGPTLEYAGPSLEPLGPELTPAARQKITTSDYYNNMADYYEHKYPDKYPNFSYYLRKSGDLRGAQLAANENAFLDYNNSNVIKIKGTESHNVPVTKAVLDSIALNGAMVGISPEEALGIPAQETNFGFYPSAWWEPEQMREWSHRNPGGYALDQEGGITPVELLNDSAYIDNPYGSTLSYLSKKFRMGDSIDDSSNMFITELTEEELDKIESELKKDRAYADKKAKDFKPAGSIFNHAYTLYKNGKYNAGDLNYSSDVYNAGKDVFNSPQIQEWWNNSGRKYYEIYAPELLNGINR